MKNERIRYELFDEIRGFSLVLLVFYHAFYDMAFIFSSDVGAKLLNFFEPLEPVFAGLFIIICGICCNFSRSNLKRGLFLLAFALGLTAVTAIFMPSEIIMFGILHMLSVGILSYTLLEKPAKRINPLLGIVICSLIFILTYNLELGSLTFFGIFNLPLPEFLYRTDIMFPLGFYSEKFYSSDYFPLFPWLFIFWAGAFFGRYAAEGRLPEFFKASHAKPLAAIGRHSLAVYILHQPITIALLYICYALAG